MPPGAGGCARVHLDAPVQAPAVGEPPAAPAEGDAPVARGPEVVEQRAAVRDALAARPADLVEHVGHGLRKDDVGRGDGQPRAERGDRARGWAHGEDGGAGAHAPGGRLGDDVGGAPAVAARSQASAALHAQRPHARVLVDLHTSLDQPLPQPEREPRRLHGGEVGHEHPSAEGGRIDPLADLLGREVLDRLRLAERRRGTDRVEAGVGERRAGRRAQIAGLAEPGVHVVVPAPGADRRHGLTRCVQQGARGGVAEALPERRGAEPKRLAEPAVAAARAVPAHAALEQEDPDARLRIEQVPGRPHPRITAPDHHHVGVERSVQGWAGFGATGLLQPPSRGGV